MVWFVWILAPIHGAPIHGAGVMRCLFFVRKVRCVIRSWLVYTRTSTSLTPCVCKPVRSGSVLPPGEPKMLLPGSMRHETRRHDCLAAVPHAVEQRVAGRCGQRQAKAFQDRTDTSIAPLPSSGFGQYLHHRMPVRVCCWGCVYGNYLDVSGCGVRLTMLAVLACRAHPRPRNLCPKDSQGYGLRLLLLRPLLGHDQIIWGLHEAYLRCLVRSENILGPGYCKSIHHGQKVSYYAALLNIPPNNPRLQEVVAGKTAGFYKQLVSECVTGGSGRQKQRARASLQQQQQPTSELVPRLIADTDDGIDRPPPAVDEAVEGSASAPDRRSPHASGSAQDLEYECEDEDVVEPERPFVCGASPDGDESHDDEADEAEIFGESTGVNEDGPNPAVLQQFAPAWATDTPEDDSLSMPSASAPTPNSLWVEEASRPRELNTEDDGGQLAGRMETIESDCPEDALDLDDVPLAERFEVPELPAGSSSRKEESRPSKRKEHRASSTADGAYKKVYTSPAEVLARITPPGCKLTLNTNKNSFVSCWAEDVHSEQWIDSLANRYFTRCFSTHDWQDKLAEVHKRMWCKWSFIAVQYPLPNNQEPQEEGRIPQAVFDDLRPTIENLPPPKKYQKL